MAAGLPAAVPLLAQQQLAARAPASTGGQQLRGVSAMPQVAAAAAAQADARRLAGKKRKPTDKAASEKPIHLIPESPLFNSLMMQEHHADELIKRRRLELQTVANPLECPVHKRLRVYIYCTHSHQPINNYTHQPGSDNTEPPHWTLTMWGRLENPDNPVAAAPQAVGAPAAGISSRHADSVSNSVVPAAGEGGTSTAGTAAPSSDKAAAPAVNVGALPPHPSQHVGTKLPFTGFFKRIAIQLDPEQYPDHNTVEWHKVQHRGAHKDRLELKRVGSQPMQVTITFEQDFTPPVYKLDAGLAEVLGMPFGQKQMALTRLYSYIINAHLQPDLSQLQLDEKLSTLLGVKQITPAALPQALCKLLQPIEPVSVTHSIDTSGPSPGAITCVDFDVLLPMKLQERLGPVLDPLLDDKQFEAHEEKLVASLTKLFEARRRRAMFLGFSENPVAFLNTIIASQAREFRTNTKQVAIERRTDLFRDKWVDEAALRYLGRKSKQEGMFALFGQH